GHRARIGRRVDREQIHAPNSSGMRALLTQAAPATIIRPGVNMWRSLVSISLCLSSAGALAQEYPTHPITMVVAFPPGGVAELTGRPTAIAMERVLKQRVIIENKPGAAGATGNAYVA